MVVVAEESLPTRFPHLLIPLIGRRHSEKVEIFAVFTESVIHDVAVFYREPQPGFDLVLPVRWSIERCVEIEPLIIRLLETAR